MTTWLPLLVPEEDYRELAEIVARRIAARTAIDSVPALFVVAPTAAELAIATGDDDIGRALAGHRAWNRDDLRRLARGETATTRRWARAMDHCADHVGEFFATSTLADAIGMPVAEWRDAQRKLGKHLRGHYPLTRGRWPLASFEAGETHVGITAEQAGLWRAVRAEPLPFRAADAAR